MVQQTPRVDDWRGLSELRLDVERTLSRSCRDHSELDDLVQETLLRAASFRRGLVDTERLRSWVLRIAWNVMRDHVRHEHRLRRSEMSDELLLQLESTATSDLAPEPASDVEIGGEDYDSDEVLALLRGLLTDLPLDDRRLYESYYTEGLVCSAAARQMNVTTQTVKMRLYRMRARLKRGLQKRAALILTPCHGALEVVA